MRNIDSAPDTPQDKQLTSAAGSPMPRSLPEYADWLDEQDLIWPATPAPEAVPAKPLIEPLHDIRAVTWSVYGTLTLITDGLLLHDHAQEVRMQVALDKTIREFNMWNSMTRRPGAPWESLLSDYRQLIDERVMEATGRRGDFTEVDSAELWHVIVDRLLHKDYEYDVNFYGSPGALAEKMAYFFHSNLQGTDGAPNGLIALKHVVKRGLLQGLLADAQSFTLVQLLRGFRGQGKLPPLRKLFRPDLLTLSYREGLRKPSKTLFALSLKRFKSYGVAPSEILHVGSRVQDDLAAAKQLGMKTALYTGDRSGFDASPDELRDPATSPDRLMTDLGQIGAILT